VSEAVWRYEIKAHPLRPASYIHLVARCSSPRPLGESSSPVLRTPAARASRRGGVRRHHLSYHEAAKRLLSRSNHRPAPCHPPTLPAHIWQTPDRSPRRSASLRAQSPRTHPLARHLTSRAPRAITTAPNPSWVRSPQRPGPTPLIPVRVLTQATRALPFIVRSTDPAPSMYPYPPAFAKTLGESSSPVSRRLPLACGLTSHTAQTAATTSTPAPRIDHHGIESMTCLNKTTALRLRAPPGTTRPGTRPAFVGAAYGGSRLPSVCLRHQQASGRSSAARGTAARICRLSSHECAHGSWKTPPRHNPPSTSNRATLGRSAPCIAPQLLETGHLILRLCLTTGIKLRGPEGAQRLRATSASMAELGAVLAAMSVLTYSTVCVSEGQASGLAEWRGQNSAILG
jgi:hypothetical protein